MMTYFQLSSKQDRDPDSSGDSSHDHHDDRWNELFQNPLIFEAVLMQSLQQGGNSGGLKLCTQEARKLRLVSKAWLLQINYIFQRHGKPLVFMRRENLKQILATNDTCNWSTPPISLSLGENALLYQGFYEDLSKFFGMGYLVAKLTSMKISEPFTFGEALADKINDTTFGLPNFPLHFKLTSLRKISLEQMTPSWTDGRQDERKKIPRLEEFLAQVLDQSETLEEFNIEAEDWLECPPGQLKKLTLPGTVTRVELDTRMNLTKMLGIKYRDWRVLEGIKTLKLTVSTRNLFGRGELEGILEGVKMSLQYLELKFRNIMFRINDVVEPEVVVKIPVMKKLSKMKIGGKSWKVESSLVLNGLGDKFPVLEHLEFYEFTDELLLRDWCGDNSVFGGVTTLTLNLGQEGMSERKMRRILRTFPKVEKLWLEYVDFSDMSGVRVMFGELGGQLRSLHLDLRGYLDREEEMEAILIGGDEEMVRRLKSERWWSGGKIWKEFLEGDNGGFKSLRDLINLEELVLVAHAGRRWDPNFQKGWYWSIFGRQNPFCFDFGCEILFEAGFMRMPNLRRLELEGGFHPGMNLMEMWKRQGKRNGQEREVTVECNVPVFPGYLDRLLGFVRNWGWWVLWVVCCVLVVICFWSYEGVEEESEGKTATEEQTSKNHSSWTI